MGLFSRRSRPAVDTFSVPSFLFRVRIPTAPPSSMSYRPQHVEDAAGGLEPLSGHTVDYEGRHVIDVIRPASLDRSLGRTFLPGRVHRSPRPFLNDLADFGVDVNASGDRNFQGGGQPEADHRPFGHIANRDPRDAGDGQHLPDTTLFQRGATWGQHCRPRHRRLSPPVAWSTWMPSSSTRVIPSLPCWQGNGAVLIRTHRPAICLPRTPVNKPERATLMPA